MDSGCLSEVFPVYLLVVALLLVDAIKLVVRVMSSQQDMDGRVRNREI